MPNLAVKIVGLGKVGYEFRVKRAAEGIQGVVDYDFIVAEPCNRLANILNGFARRYENNIAWVRKAQT